MKKLQFKTNSRHISQLGRELVTDFVTALVELIKNSYDADAYGVKIILDKPNTPQSRIVLIDTGTGMTQSDFENKWMVIGTNNKITEPYTPKGRKKAGKKGIGRFSVERLAEKVQIYSFPEFEPPYRVDINWNSFEEINIPALTQRIGILKDHQESTAAKFICNQLEYFMVTDKILQEDKDTVESILGTKSFEYPMFYKNETLRLLEDKVVPMSKMDELIGLFIEDEAANVDVYTRLFALEGLKLDCLDKLPLTVDSYYDIILEKNVDFLIIDFHLEKQVTYKGIDVLREIRKHDSTIYAVLLTNYELDDFADQFGDYDYELQKSEITSRYKDVAEKIKRACGLRKENLMYRAVEINQQQDTETIRLLQEISSKLDEKK